MHLTIWDVLNVSRIVACVTFTISSVSRILSGDPGPSWPPAGLRCSLISRSRGAWVSAESWLGHLWADAWRLQFPSVFGHHPPPPPCGRWAGGCPAVWAVGHAVPVWWSTAPGTWLIDGRVRRGSASRPAWC